MREKMLLKIALICGISGIVLLYLISDNMPIDEKAIDKISVENIEDYIKIYRLSNY